jgi:hypothetical protein
VVWRFDADEFPPYVTAIDDTLDTDGDADGYADGWKALISGASTATSSTMGATFQRMVASPNTTTSQYGIESTVGYPCVAGDVITGRASVQYATANATAVVGQWFVRFYNSADVFLSSSTVTAIAANVTPTNIPLTTFTAPASTAYVRAAFWIRGSTGANGTLAATMDVYSAKVFVNGITYTDPRGTVWTKTVADAVTPKVEAAIPFTGIAAQVGAEVLFARVGVDREGGTAQSATVVDTVDWRNRYGPLRSLTVAGLLLATDAQSDALADYLLARYDTPRYRISEITLALHGLPLDQQNKVLAIDITNMVTVKYTPNNVGTAIVQPLLVQGIRHAIGQGTHTVTLSFVDASPPYFRLGSVTYGQLDDDILAF